MARAGDIALLAPTGTELWRYERALERAGIPVASQAGKGFFRRQEIQDLIAIARALIDPRDTVALGALMRGPLVGLTEEALLDIVYGLPDDGSGRIPRFTLWTEAEDVTDNLAGGILRVLQGLARRARSTTPFGILAAAIEELRMRPILKQRHPGGAERALANVDLFLEMARPYGARGLRAFATDMRMKWENADAEMEGRPDAEEHAIRLITMHSAKGLEWPIVVPVNLMTRPRQISGILHNRADNTIHYYVGRVAHPTYETVLDLERAQDARERVRQFYVACTRAGDLLVLPSLSDGDIGWFKLIDFDVDTLPEFRLPTSGVFRRGDSESPANQQDRDTFAAEAARIRAATRVIEWHRPSRHEQMTPGEAEALDVQTRVFVDDEQSLPLPIRGGPVRGTVLHKLLEEVLTGEVGEHRTALEERAGTLIRQIGNTPVDDPAAGLAPAEIAETVRRTLDLPQISALRPALLPEIPIYNHAVADETPIVRAGGVWRSRCRRPRSG